MEEYPSNSNASKRLETKPIPEKKDIEKVISGNAKVRRKSPTRKLADVFLPEDVDDVKTYIIKDVIVPKVRDMLHDIGSEAWDSFWGIKRSKGPTVASNISYQKYYGQNRGAQFSRNSTRSGYQLDDVILDSRGEAEDVIARMDELMATYGIVSVADMYDLCGITSQYTDNKYGWTDIRSASVARIREGYVIRMPKPMPID